MKKLPIFFLSILLAASPFFYRAPNISASAQNKETYACILTTDVYFHTSESPSAGIFALPKTYYVKVLSIGNPYTKVEYLTDGERTKKLTGYCLTEKLTFVDYTPVNPYLHATFDVTYTAESGESGDAMLDKITLSCTYYGNYYIGAKEYAYVLQQGTFGYVPMPTGFTFPTNDEYAARQETGEIVITESEDGGMGVALLIVLCLLVPLLTALLVKSAKPLPYEFDE